MRMYDIIKKKRDGGTLTDAEIRFFTEGYVAGDIPDYQASALCMAIFCFLGKFLRDLHIDLLCYSGLVSSLRGKSPSLLTLNPFALYSS